MGQVDEWFKEALSNHQRGDLARAKTLYEKVLARQKGHVDANSLLGTLHVQEGQLEAGVKLLKRALAAHPSHSVAHANLGFAYHELGELEMAVKHYREAVKTDPSAIDARNNLGCAQRELGHIDEAAQTIGAVVRDAPGYAAGWYNLGLVRSQQAQSDEAIACFRKAIELNPRYYEAHYSLGNAYRERGLLDQAREAYDAALAFNPNSAEAHTNLGVLLLKQGDRQRARVHYARAVELKPDLADARNNFGALEFEEGHLDAAIEHLHKAVGSKPDHVDALANLGNALQEAGRYEEALQYCDKAVALDPLSRNAHLNRAVTLSKVQREEEAVRELLFCLDIDPNDVDALTNLGGIYALTSDYEKGRPYLERAVAAHPDNALAHWNLAIALAATGDLARAWREYEWGVYTKERALTQRYPCPKWQGQPLGEGALVVYAEQGLGDEVLFASCLPDLARRVGRDARIIVQCDPRLEALFQRSFPRMIVHGGKRDEAPDWLKRHEPVAFQLPIGSLPLHLRNSLTAFPAENVFLKADSQQQTAWRERLAALGPGLKVGIAWRSGLRTRMRSIGYTRLEDWLPVFAVEGVTLVSLQYGDCREELEEAKERLGVTIHHFDELDLFNDLDGGAALTAALDLVVSVGTSTYNFAGGLGIPTFLLSPPGRSWVHCGSDTVPWYPSVTLFAQKKRGEWLPVMERVAAALRTRVDERRASTLCSAACEFPTSTQCAERVLDVARANIAGGSGRAPGSEEDEPSALHHHSWVSALTHMAKPGAVVQVVEDAETCAFIAETRGHGLWFRPAGDNARARAGQCDILVIPAGRSVAHDLLRHCELIRRSKPLLLIMDEVGDQAQGTLAGLGYTTVAISALLRGHVACGGWCGFPTLSHSRAHPSARYGQRLSHYRAMHNSGYTHVVNGLPVHTPADHAFAGHELANYVRPIRALIRRARARTVLDYGAGTGMQYAMAIGVDGQTYDTVQQYWGVDRIHLYEPAIEGQDSLPGERADGVVCTHVLEQIPEQDVPWVLDELFTHAQQFVFMSVACYPGADTLPDGNSAHLTARSPDWWCGVLTCIAARHSEVSYLMAAVENGAHAEAGATVRWLSNLPLPAGSS